MLAYGFSQRLPGGVAVVDQANKNLGLRVIRDQVWRAADLDGYEVEGACAEEGVNR